MLEKIEFFFEELTKKLSHLNTKYDSIYYAYASSIFANQDWYIFQFCSLTTINFATASFLACVATDKHYLKWPFITPLPPIPKSKEIFSFYNKLLCGSNCTGLWPDKHSSFCTTNLLYRPLSRNIGWWHPLLQKILFCILASIRNLMYNSKSTN